MNHYQFQTVPTLISGLGSIQELARLIKQGQYSRILLLTDQGMIDHNLHQPLIHIFEDTNVHYAIYSKVQPDPSEAIILEAAHFAIEAESDLIIGFGGGSSLDVAKLVAVLAHEEQTSSLQQLYGIHLNKIPRLDLILIPTTAGTGSEVTPISIVTTHQNTKMGVVCPALFADATILDANFTLSLPRHITASTGIDAMVHAIEAYTSVIKKNPYSDLLAKSALRLLNDNLPKVLNHPHDAQARQAMLEGSMLAGQAFANAPVGAVHALAYPLGGTFHIPHGHSNALVLIEVLKFNAPIAKKYYAELMTWLDPKSTGCIDGLCDLFIDHLYNHLQASQLPLSLDSFNIPETALEQLATDAMCQTRLLQNNPRPLTQQDALKIYQAIYRKDLSFC